MTLGLEWNGFYVIHFREGRILIGHMCPESRNKTNQWGCNTCNAACMELFGKSSFCKGACPGSDGHRIATVCPEAGVCVPAAFRESPAVKPGFPIPTYPLSTAGHIFHYKIKRINS